MVNKNPGDMIFNYIPARLVRGATWYITWTTTNPETLERQRHRRTFDLNRITALRTRRAVAKKYIAEINARLAAGMVPHDDQNPSDNKTTLGAALAMALGRKKAMVSAKTYSQYSSVARIFSEWITAQGFDQAPALHFTGRLARAFFDHLMPRGLTGKTLNNYLIALKALFYELVRSEYLDQNPFSSVPKFRESRKMRRTFSRPERLAIVAHLKKHDPECLLVCALIYHCMIRPNELRHLQIGHVRIDEGVIFLPGQITKNRDDALVTIPDILIEFIRKFRLDRFGPSWYLFGRALKPHPAKPCGANAMNYRHAAALKALKMRGAIVDITGLSLYSWKDTGDQDLATSGVDLLTIRDHNRHKSLETTNKYMQTRPRRLGPIARWSGSIFD